MPPLYPYIYIYNHEIITMSLTVLEHVLWILGWRRLAMKYFSIPREICSKQRCCRKNFGFSAVNSGWKLRGWKFSEKMDPGIIINNNASTSAKICDSSESLKARNDGTGMNWVQKCEHQTWGLSVSTQQCSSQMPQTYASSLFKVNVLLQIAFSRYHAYSEYRCLMVV